MNWSLYLNKRTNELNEDFITIGIKTNVDGIITGEIYDIPASTFFNMVDTIKTSPSHPVLYINDSASKDNT